MRFRHHALSIFLGFLSLLSLAATNVALGQDSYWYEAPTTCNTPETRLRYKVYLEVYHKPMIARGKALEAAMDGAVERLEEVEAALAAASLTVTLFDLYGPNTGKELATAFASSATTAIDFHGDGIWADVVAEAFDAALVLADRRDPASVADYIVDKGISFGARLGATLELTKRLPERTTLAAIGSVLSSYYWTCEDKQQTLDLLGISESWDTSKPFLTWATQEYARRHGYAGPFNWFIEMESTIQARIDAIELGIQADVLRLKRLWDPSTALTVGGIYPHVLTGSFERQSIRILGAGFGPNASLRFYNSTGDCNPCLSSSEHLRVVNGGGIDYGIVTGSDVATWEVEVADEGETSNRVSFRVEAPVDNTPPLPPKDFNAFPLVYSNDGHFNLNWSNPYDPSGITKVWYKLDSAPASPEAGTPLELPLNNPIPVQLSTEGEAYVHVWLEDGAGNKDHRNRVAVPLRYDVTPPTVQIATPVSSRGYYTTADPIVTVSGQLSDDFSGVDAVVWVSDRGVTGIADANDRAFSIPDLALYPGANVVYVTALDQAGNVGYDQITVERTTGDKGPYVLDLLATNGRIERNPDRELYEAGTSVELTAVPASGYTFVQWGEDASGISNPTTVVIGEDMVVEAEFEREGDGGDDGSGSVEVTISPAMAVAAGARWRVVDESDPLNGWRRSGSADVHVPLGEHEIEFRQVHGWVAPPNQRVSLTTDVRHVRLESDLYRPVSPLPPPLGPTAGVEGGRVVLRWTPLLVSSLNAYRVYRSTSPAAQDLVAEFPASTEEFIDASADPQTLYYYRITAVDENGAESTFSEEVRSLETPVITRGTELYPSDGYSGSFGGFHSVAAGGDFAFVGAPQHSEKGERAGTVYVFERQGEQWSFKTKLYPSDATPQSEFGSSVSADGRGLLVGADGDDEVDRNAGAAYYFARNQGQFVEEEKFKGQHRSGNLGYAVALGSSALVSEPDVSAVHVYQQRAGSGWRMDFTITDRDRDEDDDFGNAVAYHASRSVVGAREDDDQGSDAGAAYVYLHSHLEATLYAPDAADGDEFGNAVAIADPIAVVGAPKNDDRGTNTGAVHVFRRSGDQWVHEAKLIGSTTTGGDRFGYALALEENTLVVGGRESETAFIFKYENGTWAETARIMLPEGSGVRSVDLSGSWAILGTGNAPAWVFPTEGYPPGQGGLSTLDVRAFLSGSYSGGAMATALHSDGLLPASHPYSAAPWNYNGDEAADLASISNAVDWVLLELRAAPDAEPAARRAALLLSDGRVVDLDGQSAVAFADLTPGPYHVVVRHRNHLAVMSAEPVDFSGGPIAYDFTTGLETAYSSGAPALVDLGGGAWGLIGGDADGDGRVAAPDNVAWLGANGSSPGYLGTDLDLSGRIGAPDKVEWLGANGSVTQVPTP